MKTSRAEARKMQAAERTERKVDLILKSLGIEVDADGNPAAEPAKKKAAGKHDPAATTPAVTEPAAEPAKA